MKIQTSKRMIPSTGRDIKILIMQPVKHKQPAEKTPAILWIHGGGLMVGFAEMARFMRPKGLVAKYGAVVVSVGYRLSTEAPYPAAIEDCYSALKWLKEHARELGCNPDQIMVGGESAGGGLTAAVCMMARDKGEVKIAFQMPLYPMLDDRDTESSRDNHAPIWDTEKNHRAWGLYLKGMAEVSPYAAPARQTDYSNLPPAYTFVGDKEPFYCETLTYIDNLQKAGVSAKVDVYENCVHGLDMICREKGVKKRAVAEFEKQYLYAAEHYFAPQD